MNTPRIPLGLVWLRRDLRLHDHRPLLQALACCDRVALVFVFDTEILDALPAVDRRVGFIHASLLALQNELRALGGVQALWVLHGAALTLIPALAQQLHAGAVFAARDVEPFSQTRDADVATGLQAMGLSLHLCWDHMLVPPDALHTGSGKPYTVFTPYYRRWLAYLADHPATPQPLPGDLPRRWWASTGGIAPPPLPTLQALGFSAGNLDALGLGAGEAGAQALVQDFLQRLDQYDALRDFPARKGPSYLSTHLRFGTVSVRTLAARAWVRQLAGSSGARVWLSELAWRDFYIAILAHFPHVVQRAFKPDYDAIAWEEGDAADAATAAWCEGRTGYPLVDAAMRQLQHSGYMHNRLRMVAGSFLVKHLGVDWRTGERHFALQLNDFDLAANNGGWQWVASSGCDAQPYFRIFNPIAQSQRFDPQGQFIRRYVPELVRLPERWIHAPWLAPEVALREAGVALGQDYPRPIVDHARARQRTLLRYAVVKSGSSLTSAP